MATWRTLLADHLFENSLGGIDTIIHYAPNEAAFDVEFDDGYGSVNGPEILAWSEDRVFFPVSYDGSESIGSAPRNPQSEGQPHIGVGW
ncbi:MAG: hypothetical protein A2Y38_25670 [Spirochaetes bacterium GWB1_59_5]|nr:MAG: hypothetical protein A2Y38_25670 [Spirochaetes bacterium GWB1_59_5]